MIFIVSWIFYFMIFAIDHLQKFQATNDFFTIILSSNRCNTMGSVVARVPCFFVAPIEC